MILKKILWAMVNPWKWRKLWQRIRLLTENIIDYRLFSLNPNTKRHWNDKLSAVGDFWRDENYHHILDMFPQDEAFSLLDIGCAIGDGCELLKEKFPKAEITGVDISDIAIEKAKNKTRSVQYFVLDILKEPIPEKYDYIVIVETLEHFDTPFVVIDRCLKHVRKSIIVSVPYGQSITGGMLRESEHRHSFDEKSFTNYNCRIVKVTEFVEVTGDRCIIYEIRP